MPGGKGNIRPGDNPKQFKPGNKAAEKWTEKKALELGNQLIVWMKEKDQEGNDKGHIFYEEFFVLEKNYYLELPSYLSRKFTTFLKLIGIARTIQEAKLLKYGVADRLNVSLVKFCLINHHGYFNRQHIDHTTQGKSIQKLNITMADKAMIERVERLINREMPN